MDPETRLVLWESCPLCSKGYWKLSWSGVGHRGTRYKRLVTARPALLITLAGKGSHVSKPFLMLSWGLKADNKVQKMWLGLCLPAEFASIVRR